MYDLLNQWSERIEFILEVLSCCCTSVHPVLTISSKILYKLLTSRCFESLMIALILYLGSNGGVKSPGCCWLLSPDLLAKQKNLLRCVVLKRWFCRCFVPWLLMHSPLTFCGYIVEKLMLKMMISPLVVNFSPYLSGGVWSCASFYEPLTGSRLWVCGFHYRCMGPTNWVGPLMVEWGV